MSCPLPSGAGCQWRLRGVVGVRLGAAADIIGQLSQLGQAGGSLDVFARDVHGLSDPIVAGHVRRRKSAVAGMEWRIEANGAPDSVCDTLAELFSGFDLYRLINQILDATLYGYQPLEVIWQRGSLWLPSEIVAKPQEWFQFDQDGQLRFRLSGSLNDEPVPAFKFLCPTHNASYINPYGIGDLSTVYWPTIFKRGGLKFWAEFSEKFGAP